MQAMMKEARAAEAMYRLNARPPLESGLSSRSPTVRSRRGALGKALRS